MLPSTATPGDFPDTSSVPSIALPPSSIPAEHARRFDSTAWPKSSASPSLTYGPLRDSIDADLDGLHDHGMALEHLRMLADSYAQTLDHLRDLRPVLWSGRPGTDRVESASEPEGHLSTVSLRCAR